MSAFSGWTPNPLLDGLRKARRQLFLQPDGIMELFTLIGVRAPLRPGVRMTPGRGVLVIDRVPLVVQVAMPEDRQTSQPAAATTGGAA